MNSKRARGFTILEILIATAILTLGLVSILALFPYAIDSGRKVMERSTAAAIAKSVAEQIRSGLRNRKRLITTGAVPYVYFVFEHDGVKDPIPASQGAEKPAQDYYILLPQFRPNQKFDGGSEDDRRDKSVANASEFVYPEAEEPMNGGGDPFRAHNDALDGPNGSGIVVRKVYTVGNLLPDEDNSKRLQEVMILDDQKTDPLKQYSYAFSIRASKYDTNASDAGRTYIPGNNLYHVRIMVFRAFIPWTDEKVKQEGRGPEAIYELDFEVAK